MATALMVDSLVRGRGIHVQDYILGQGYGSATQMPLDTHPLGSVGRIRNGGCPQLCTVHVNGRFKLEYDGAIYAVSLSVKDENIVN